MIDIAKMPRAEQIKYRLSNIGENIGEVALEYIADLEKEKAELSNSVTELTNTKTELENKVTELKAQNEKMKCCGNCKKQLKNVVCVRCKNNSEWELAE